MSLIISLVMPYLSIIGLIVFALNRLRVHFTIAPLFSLSFIIIMLYFFTLFSVANIGIFIIFFLNIIFIFDFIVSFLLKNGWIRENAEMIIALIFYSVIILILTLLSKRWYFQCWDEYMHWYPFVQQIYKTNSFFTSGSFFINANYVQGLPLLAVYFAKLGIFTDGTLILSNNILLLSSFFVFLRHWDKKNNILINGLHLLLLYFLVNTFSVLLINTFVADTIVGAVCASIMYILYIDNSSRSMQIVFPILLAYVFVKDVCIYFAGYMLLLLVVWDILQQKDLTSKKMIIPALKKYLVPFLGIFASYGIWALRLRLLNIQGDMRILLDIRELWIAFFTQENAFYQSVLDNFYYQLSSLEFVKSFSMLELFLIFTLLIPVSAIVFPKSFRKKEIFFSSSLAVSFLGYCFLLVATILGSRREGQPLYADSEGFYLRYFSSFCVLFMLVFFNFIVNSFLNRDDEEKSQVTLKILQTLFTLTVCAFTLFNSLTEYRISNFLIEPDFRWKKAKEIHKKFGGIFEENSRALIINFDNDQLEWLMINGVFTGEMVTFVRERMDFSVENTSPYEFRSLFEWTDTNYLFLYKSSEIFWSGYSNLFEQDEYVRDINPMIYRFDRDKKLFIFVAK